MSRPASRPARLPPQPVDSRHHGAVHGARCLVQDREMKGEQGPDESGRTTRCSSRWGLPPARQQSRLIPVNPTLSQRISLRPGESQLVPVDPTLSHRISLCPGESHFILTNPTLSRRIPVFLTAIAARAPPAGHGWRPMPAWTLPKRGRRNGPAPPVPAEHMGISERRQRCRSPSDSGLTRSRSRARAPSGAGSISARRAGSIHCGRLTASSRRSPSSK